MFNFPTLILDQTDAVAVDDVEMVELCIRITNKSNKQLGVYFLEGNDIPPLAYYSIPEYDEGGVATGNTITSIKLEDTIKVDDEELVDVFLTPYAHIGVTTDQATMSIYFESLDWVDAYPELDFSYTLVFEEYTTETVEGDDRFIKYSPDLETLPTSDSSLNGNLGMVVIPNGVTSIAGASIFAGNGQVNQVYIPNSVKNVNEEGEVVSWDMTPNKFYVSKDNPYFSNDNNFWLYNKDKTKLYQTVIYDDGSAECIMEIPNTVTSVGVRAFEFPSAPTITTIIVSPHEGVEGEFEIEGLTLSSGWYLIKDLSPTKEALTDPYSVKYSNVTYFYTNDSSPVS